MRAIMSLLMALAICVPPLAAQDLQSQDQQSSHILAQIVDKIVERENQEIDTP